MSDHPIPDRVMLNAAIDGGDWPLAAFTLLASPMSEHFSRIIAERLASIGFQHVACQPSDQALIRRLADIEAKAAA